MSYPNLRTGTKHFETSPSVEPPKSDAYLWFHQSANLKPVGSVFVILIISYYYCKSLPIVKMIISRSKHIVLSQHDYE